MESEPNSPTDDTRQRRLLPERITEPCRRFLHDWRQLHEYVGFVSALVLRADENARVAAEALLPGAKSEEEKLQYKTILDDKTGRARRNFWEYRQILFQMMICRAVDNFLTYISELLALIFRSRPEALRSNQQVRIQSILEFKTMDELVEALAEQRVHQLSYMGMNDLAIELADRLGIEMFPNESLKKDVIELVEVRNLIVHNRAIINRVHLSRIEDSKLKLGEKLEFDVDDVFERLTKLHNAALDLDNLAVAKFSLVTISSKQLQLSQ